MTFLEWEIYYRHELEETTKVVKNLLDTADGVLSREEMNALRTLLALSEHVIDRGRVDESTGKWKIE